MMESEKYAVFMIEILHFFKYIRQIFQALISKSKNDKITVQDFETICIGLKRRPGLFCLQRIVIILFRR